MGKLITNTGREIECSVTQISPVLHILYLVFPFTGIQEIATIFCDDSETKKLKFVPDDPNAESKTFTGFTILVDIVPEPFGTRIGMRTPYYDEVAQHGDY